MSQHVVTREEWYAMEAPELGMTFGEINVLHGGKCGACRTGVMHLRTVSVAITPWKFPFPDIKVTILVACDDCDVELEMPFRRREGK